MFRPASSSQSSWQELALLLRHLVSTSRMSYLSLSLLTSHDLPGLTVLGEFPHSRCLGRVFVASTADYLGNLCAQSFDLVRVLLRVDPEHCAKLTERSVGALDYGKFDL